MTKRPGDRWYGKILGGLLGFALLRHPIGLLVGAVLGHALDSGWFKPRRPRPDALPEAYAVLGVTPDAPDAEIETAYRRLMARCHPDRLGNATPEVRAAAEQQAAAVNGAYDFIMAARKRRRGAST